VPATPNPPRLPPKKDVFLALLEQTSVYVHLDPRQSEVRVPEWFKKEPQLILQIGLNLAVPIRDLFVDDEGASCTLSFSRSPHSCFMPWPAVYALVGEDGRGMVWPDDVPAEVASQQAQRAKDPQSPKKKRAARPKLRAVDSGSSQGDSAEEREPVQEPNAAAVSEPREAPLSPAAEEAGEITPDAEAGEGSERAGTAGRRLPPYLRVVK
jgi:stringent starvation protein B